MAKLQIEVESKGINQADKELENLGKTGATTESKLTKMSKGFKVAAASVAGVTAGVAVASAALNKMEGDFRGAIDVARDFNNLMGDDLRASLIGSGESMDILDQKVQAAEANISSSFGQIVYEANKAKLAMLDLFTSDESNAIVTDEDLAEAKSRMGEMTADSLSAIADYNRKARELAQELANERAETERALHERLVSIQIEQQQLGFQRQLLGTEEYNRQRLALEIERTNVEIGLSNNAEQKKQLERKLIAQQATAEMVQIGADATAKEEEEKEKVRQVKRIESQQNSEAALLAQQEKEREFWQSHVTGINTIEAEANRERLLMLEEQALQTTAVIQSAGSSLSSSLSSGINGLIDGSKDAKDAMLDVVTSVTSSIIKSGVDILVQQYITDNILKALNLQTVTSQVAQNTALAAQAAYVSAVQTPIVGLAIAPAAATAAATAAAGIGAPAVAAAGARQQGGAVNAGSTYLVGERGPELVTMGGSGRVTSNSQMNNMGASPVNVVVNNNAPNTTATAQEDSSGNVYVTIEELPSLMANEGGNPDSQFNQAQSRVYNMARN